MNMNLNFNIKQKTNIDFKLGKYHIKDTLLNCPFCGSPSKLDIYSGHQTNYHINVRVGCFKCEIAYKETLGMGSDNGYIIRTVEDCIASWNARI